MSDIGSDFGYAPVPHFLRTAPVMASVEDVYHLTRGTFDEFQMQGYEAPRTAIPLSSEHAVPKDKNRDIFLSITKRAKDPDPATYAADDKMIEKRFWTTANGKIHPGKRKTFTEEVIEISKKIPGPGNYMPIPKGEPVKTKAELGKFR